MVYYQDGSSLGHGHGLIFQLLPELEPMSSIMVNQCSVMLYNDGLKVMNTKIEAAGKESNNRRCTTAFVFFIAT